VVGQRRHDRVIRRQRPAREERDPIAVVNDPLGHAPRTIAEDG
jgi:hypothetical protein